MSKNTGASRAALNTLSRRAPREYIVIVGAPTNFFNGYYTFAALQEGLRRGEPPEGSWDFQVAGPDPRTRREIDWYLDFTPKAVPIAADAPDHVWKQHGWSQQARDELKKRSWRPEQTMSWPSSTHDLYWGNFIDPAMRLYQFESPLRPPLTRPRPQPGDILTYLVYHPGYLLRDTIDFDASPHNMDHRHKPDAAYVWNPGGTPSGPARWAPPSDKASRAAFFPPGQAKFAEMSLDEQADVLARAGGIDSARAKDYLTSEGMTKPVFGFMGQTVPPWEQEKIYWDALTHIRNGERPGGPYTEPISKKHERRLQWKANQDRDDAGEPMSEQDVNFHIMVRRVSRNSADTIKRNTGLTISTRLNTMVEWINIKDVLTKVLFFSETSQVADYIARGTWSGRPRHRSDSVDPGPDPRAADERAFYRKVLESCTREGTDAARIDALTPTPFGSDNYQLSAYDRGGLPEGWKWNAAWDASPSVDRKRVLIHRLDYFGHASNDSMMLLFGWTNRRGQPAGGESDPITGSSLAFSWPEIDAWFAGDSAPTTPDSTAMLWGCHLGTPVTPGEKTYPSLAPWLADLKRFGTVIGADTTTSFTQIVSSPHAFPVPSDGRPWCVFGTPP